MSETYCYTDGSHDKGIGGWAYVILKEDKIAESGGSDDTTNNEMELYAVYECLGKILEIGKRGDTYVIVSDSQYVLKSLGMNKLFRRKRDICGWIVGWVNKDALPYSRPNGHLWFDIYYCLLDKIFEKGIALELRWVKGHSGDLYNDVVDDLAKRARRKIEKQNDI